MKMFSLQEKSNELKVKAKETFLNILDFRHKDSIVNDLTDKFIDLMASISILEMQILINKSKQKVKNHE